MCFRNILKDTYIFFMEKQDDRRKKKGRKIIPLKRKASFWQSTKGAAGIHSNCTPQMQKCEPCHPPETLWRYAGFHAHIWLPKNQRHCPTSDRGTRYNKASGAGIWMQMCSLHSVTSMYDFPQIEHPSPKQLSWFAICFSAASCHHIYCTFRFSF